MPKIYRMTIGLDKEGKRSWSDIHSVDMTDELYDKFKWDGMVRLDIISGDTVAILSDKLEWMQACHYGVKTLTDVIVNWDTIFSTERKEEMERLMKEKVEESNNE